MRYALTIVGLLILLTAASCSNSPPLQTDSSTSAIRAAEAVGATDVPRAALHLQLAREGVDRANALAQAGKKDEAESQLLRAEADAELAILLAQEQDERTAATQAMARVRQLQRDNR
jgi:hypothetical protein